MTNPSEQDIIKALDVLSQISDKYRYEKICEMSSSQRDKYKQLLDNFKLVHERKQLMSTSNWKKVKGDALEELVSHLLAVSGNLFLVERNLRTTTNEIDQLVMLTPNGKILLGGHLINSKLNCFLCECKNYDEKVGVTYVGKFCSLMLTNGVKLGILFSYHGVSGKQWSNGAGLIKKFYLHKEKIEDRYCIIDFSINEFESILKGKNLLQIIDEQLISLQLDTDYTRYLTKHPAEQ